jgi:hypothetical protein
VGKSKYKLQVIGLDASNITSYITRPTENKRLEYLEFLSVLASEYVVKLLVNNLHMFTYSAFTKTHDYEMNMKFVNE